MIRTTRATLQGMLDIINRDRGNPRQPYRFEIAEENGERKGRWVPNIGHIGLSTDSPGDGRTRYHVFRLMDHGGEDHLSPTMTAAEAWFYLRGVLDAINRRFDKE